MRCTCNEDEAAEGLAQIVPRSPVPIIADIHFQYKLALAAMEAGVHGLRLNPGNIRKPEHIKTVAAEASDRGLPIRIGVNAGSLDPSLYEKYGGATPEAMVESAQREIAYFDEVGFDDDQDLGEGVERAADGRGVPPAVRGHRLPAAPRRDRGRPAAGGPGQGDGRASPRCCSRASATRSATRSPPTRSRRREAGRQLLEALGLRERKNVDLIACPSCGRAEVDVIDVANQAMEAFADREIPLQIAVMGCVVNGPGEARDADLGIAAGNKRGHLFVKGQNVAVVPEDEMVEQLVEWAEFINEHGVEAALARADLVKAAREAEKDRAKLLDDQGADANHVDREDRRDPQDRPADRTRDRDAVSRPHGVANGVGRHADGEVEAVESGRTGESAGRPGEARRRNSWPVDVCVRPARAARACTPAPGAGTDRTRRRIDHHGLGERRRVDDAQQFVDVDRLDRQPAPHDVVARPHQLDAGTAQVGVEVAGREVDRLARAAASRG